MKRSTIHAVLWGLTLCGCMFLLTETMGRQLGVAWAFLFIGLHGLAGAVILWTRTRMTSLAVLWAAAALSILFLSWGYFSGRRLVEDAAMNVVAICGALLAAGFYFALKKNRILVEAWERKMGQVRFWEILLFRQIPDLPEDHSGRS